MTNKSPSDTTIYTPALKKKKIEQITQSPVASQRDSDELIDKISNFLEKIRVETTPPDEEEPTSPDNEEEQQPAATPGHSGYGGEGADRAEYMRARDSAEKMILEAEKHKARVTAPQGRVPLKPTLDTVSIDNEHFYLTSHIDEPTKEKIRGGEYVDLEKLLPKPRGLPSRTDEKRIDMVNRDGQSFLVASEEKTIS